MARTLLGSLLNRTTAAPPVPFASRAASYGRGWFGYNRSATAAQMSAMGSVGTLFSIVHRTSNATSQVEWKLWRKARSGLPEDRVEVTAHAALDLWQRPNPFMPRQEFVEGSQQHIDLTGEGWWVLARDERSPIPLEIWYVRPDRMRPVPDPERYLAGYMYTSPDGEEIALRLDQVIQLRMPNPMDPYRGMGPVQSIMTDLDSSRYAAEWNKNFFANSAEPGGIITTPSTLDDQQFDQLRTRWNEQHKGVANAHRVAILEGGLTWVDRSISQRDMQFVELRGITSDQIREAFGISKFAIGDIDDVNRATAEAAADWFAEYMTVPRLERIKAALNHGLLPLFGGPAVGLEFDYVSPVKGSDADAADVLSRKATAAKTLIDAGAYGPEVLQALSLPALSFGQPGLDQDRELLVQLVTRAPTLAPTILPLLGFDLSASPKAGASEPTAWLPEGSTLLGSEGAGRDGGPENAMRWEAVAHIDDNTCQPCADNDGTVYRNRAAAYKDYPGGSGYVNCVGAEHGNECRCKVIKRRKTGDDE